MRPKLKHDEVRFRHAANDNPGASLESIADTAGVPMSRAKNLHRRWLGGSGQALPPLPPPIENTPADDAGETQAKQESEEDSGSVSGQRESAVEPGLERPDAREGVGSDLS